MNNDVIKQLGLRIKHIGLEWPIIVTFYLLISLFFITAYIHQISADGISYISLAQKYLTGDFTNAISGHWAPLISLLLVPFLYLNVEPILAFRMASIAIGILTLIGIDKLMVELQILKSIRVLYLLSLGPLIAWSAQNEVGADLLCACLLIHYLEAVLRDDYQNKKYAGFRAGLLGGLSYLAKNYNLYFILLHFVMINVAFWNSAADKRQRKTLTVNFLSAIVLFALVSGIWIGLVSHKYKKFTVGTAGDYNFSYIRPGCHDHPMLTEGFLVPPNGTAVSAWEDPTSIKFPPWNPFRSPDDIRYYSTQIYKNIFKYLRGMATNYIFDLTILYFFVTMLFLKKQFKRKVYYILLTILLYPLGYLALYYDGQRYVWFNTFLVYVLSAYIVSAVFIQFKSRITVRICISIILSMSLIALAFIRFSRDQPERFALNGAYSVSRQIKEFYLVENKNIASQDGDWFYTFDLSYFLKARFFGRAKADITNEELRKELLADNIHYYLVYGKLKNNIDILNPGKDFASAIGDFTIYKVVRPE